LILGLLANFGLVSQTRAIEVTPGNDTQVLTNALLNPLGGIDPRTVSTQLSGHVLESGIDNTGGDAVTATFFSSGTYTNNSGTYGLGDGVILSTGDVSSYGDGPNNFASLTTNYETRTKSTPVVPDDPLNVNPGAMGILATTEQDALLDPLDDNDPANPADFNHYDVTQLDIHFDMKPGFDAVYVNVVFGSEEFNEFVGSRFVDAFGAYVNGENKALVSSAPGQPALPININHQSMVGSGGTELDGILGSGQFGEPLVHTFSSLVDPANNTVTLILGDTEDGQWDATVYVAQLTGYRRGDLDGDGELTGIDLQRLQTAVSDVTRFRSLYPDIHPVTGDMNFDGVLHHLDIDTLSAIVPEPGALSLFAVTGLLFLKRRPPR